MAHFLYSAMEDRPVTIYGDGRQVRDVLCVDDLVRAFESVRAHQNKTAGEAYNVGGGIANTVSLLELIEEVETLTGKRLRYELDRARPGDQLVYVSDYGKLQRHVGWEPRMSVRETLASIHDWWTESRHVFAPVGVPRRSPGVLEQMPEAAS